jgi:hypothetical protein
LLGGNNEYYRLLTAGRSIFPNAVSTGSKFSLGRCFMNQIDWSVEKKYGGLFTTCLELLGAYGASCRKIFNIFLYG